MVTLKQLIEHDKYLKKGDTYISAEDLYNKVKEIGEKYGISLNDADISIRTDGWYKTWFVLPYSLESGFECDCGNWSGINICSDTIHFMENDFDMFDEIAEYLADVETDFYDNPQDWQGYLPTREEIINHF